MATDRNPGGARLGDVDDQGSEGCARVCGVRWGGSRAVWVCDVGCSQLLLVGGLVDIVHGKSMGGEEKRKLGMRAGSGKHMMKRSCV